MHLKISNWWAPCLLCLGPLPVPIPSCPTNLPFPMLISPSSRESQPSAFNASFQVLCQHPALNSPLQVQSQGPAGRAGVENDDFLVEVNGVNVTNESYDKVVARIQSSGDRLTLLVCSKDAYRYFQGQNIPITASMADSDTSEPPAYTENHPSEPERNSPEPRERVSNPALGRCWGITQGIGKELFFQVVCFPELGLLTWAWIFASY